MATATISAPITGNKLYQIRARKCLPLLVRQARAGKPISYSDLAQELEIPNPRNLNYVLGSIGQTLELLSNELGTKVPPLQCLVVNKATGLPGEGIGWFLIKKEDFTKLPLQRKRKIVNAELQHIYTYMEWNKVLDRLGLEAVNADFPEDISSKGNHRSGGEGAAHKALKEFVACNPRTIGLNTNLQGTQEQALLSGDSLDVSFETRNQWVCAEVKSAISNKEDILRGLFQCIKYQAVMEAQLLSKNIHLSVRTVLVLESEFPKDLISLRNTLGVEVIDNIRPY